jgi:hypothetical protein
MNAHNDPGGMDRLIRDIEDRTAKAAEPMPDIVRRAHVWREVLAEIYPDASPERAIYAAARDLFALSHLSGCAFPIDEARSEVGAALRPECDASRKRAQRARNLWIEQNETYRTKAR